MSVVVMVDTPPTESVDFELSAGNHDVGGNRP